MSLVLLFLPTAGGGGGATAPTVTTDSVTTVTVNSALANGTVSSDGGATITERGFVYATTQNPTTANTKSTVSGTTGAFSSSLSGLVSNTTYYVRAFATNSEGTSYGSQISFTTLSVTNVHKHFFYRVYNKNGSGYTYLTTWSDDVFSDPAFRTVINSPAGEMVVKLARPFDDFGEDTDVKLANKVECYAVDKENPNGQLLYTGYISGYKPIIRGVEEYVEVTLFSFGARLQRMILKDVSNNTEVAYNSTDPATILKSVIDLGRRLGLELTYTSSSIDLTNTTVSYTFNTNTLKECFDKVIELCPSGWYYRIDPDGTVYLKPKHLEADHVFTVGLNVENLETHRRIEDLVNKVLFTGGGTPHLFRKYENTASQDVYGLHEIKIVDERVTSATTAQIMSEREINTKKDPEIRSILTLVDSNGPDNRGYDIESVKVGETMQIKNLKTTTSTPSLWDVAQWNVDVWDQSLSLASTDTIQILSVTYTPDSIEIEASSRIPQIAKRIEDINRNLQNAQTNGNPSAPS